MSLPPQCPNDSMCGGCQVILDWKIAVAIAVVNISNLRHDNVTVKVFHFDGKGHLVASQGWVSWNSAIALSNVFLLLPNGCVVWYGKWSMLVECHQLPNVILGICMFGMSVQYQERSM